MQLYLDSEDSTAEFAFKLAGILPLPCSLGLVGELGIGKTTLVRHLCKAYGIQEAVSSPSYVLQHEYNALGGVRIEHWDLYRISGALPGELDEPTCPGCLRIIEWPDRVSGLMDRLDRIIFIDWGGQKGANGRNVRLEGF